VITKRRALVISIAVGVPLVVPTASHACSKVGFQAIRSANTAHFIATTMADTVLTGAGTVRYVVAPGHSGPAVERLVFGQVVAVERIGGLASRGLRQPQRVVLVPWDYGPDCTPTPWTRSAAWVDAGTRGLFSGVLRDSVHWAGGVPTFDVFAPEFEPYPQRVERQRRGRSVPQDSMVSMEELFQLIELFPDQRLLPDSAEAATAALFAWARANPALNHRYPIANALTSARYLVARQRLRAIRSPFVGTYQLTVSLSGGSPRVFYARTRSFPTTAWSFTEKPERPVDDPTTVPRPDGYTLLAAVSLSVDSLPENCYQRRDITREGYLAVVDARPDSTTDARSWIGKLEVDLAERAFRGDAALGQFAKAEFEAYSRRSRAGLRAEAPARFTRSADGSIRVEQTLTLDDGRSLTYSGMRVSPDVVACRW
jgi:hypothetical protein